MAAYFGHFKLAKILLGNEYEKKILFQSNKYTNVHYAIATDNDLDMVKKLVGLNRDNTKLVVPSNGWSLLHYAVYYNRQPILEYLLTVVENKEPIDKEGRTPAQMAVHYGKWNFAKILKE